MLIQVIVKVEYKMKEVLIFLFIVNPWPQLFKNCIDQSYNINMV